MPRIAAISAGLLAALLLLSQLVVPWLAESRVEDRLESRGGQANVSVSAVPALRLLFDEGDSLKVTGEGLRLNPLRQQRPLERLDGFDEVSVHVRKLDAGPLAVSSFVLERRGGKHDYELGLAATTTPREVASFLGSEAGGAFGRLLGDFAGGTLPGGGNVRIPLALDAIVHSDGGAIAVGDVSGSIAGIPTGPLAKLVISAVVSRL
jgi:hypothetical protein